MLNFVLMKLFTQISSIIISLLFIYTINFKSFVTINYLVNQTTITELFCINKDKPQLECNGKCHLTKELIKAESENTETPFPQSINEFNTEFISYITDENTLPSTAVINKNKWLNYSESIINMDYTIITPPPKV